MEEALDIFLLTYRSTPNRQVKGDLSPAEAMFGRRIRTSLDLLRPPVRPPHPTQQAEGTPKRSFAPHDLVYAKIYSNNKWSWEPGVVCENIGRVMYTVWVSDRRLIRSHVNQLRDRGVSSSSDPAHQRKLPLDVLLDSWDLPRPTTPVGSPSRSGVPTPQLTPISSSSSLADSPDLTATNMQASASRTSTPVPSTSSSSTSSSAASGDFASAGSGPSTPIPEQPRRSSRTRRPPQWFDPYHLY